MNRKEKLLEALPASFNREEYLRIVASLSVKEEISEYYITELVKNNLIHREKKDTYINPYAKTAESQ